MFYSQSSSESCNVVVRTLCSTGAAEISENCKNSDGDIKSGFSQEIEELEDGKDTLKYRSHEEFWF